MLEIQPFVVVTYISLFGTLGRYATCSPRVQVFPSSPLHSTGGKHYIHSYDTTLTYCTCSSPARSLGPTHAHANRCQCTRCTDGELVVGGMMEPTEDGVHSMYVRGLHDKHTRDGLGYA